MVHIKVARILMLYDPTDLAIILIFKVGGSKKFGPIGINTSTTSYYLMRSYLTHLKNVFLIGYPHSATPNTAKYFL